MIKIDMNMPRYCCECPFYSGYNGGLCLVDEYNDLFFGSTCIEIERHPRCPLQEVEEDD